ncbi:MAG TPA: nitroreductase/quinone reductase family protein [Spirillospora sp.]|nr:nitroreductase/quinone reductase family protein [Spirillospora sp.]
MKEQLMKMLLLSPLHSLISNRTALLSFKDRTTGAEQSIPVTYARTGDIVTCFGKLNQDWWRSVKENTEVRVHVRGQELQGHAQVITADDDRELIINRLMDISRNLTYSDAVDQAPTTVMIQVNLAPETARDDARKLAT